MGHTYDYDFSIYAIWLSSDEIMGLSLIWKGRKEININKFINLYDARNFLSILKEAEN